MSKYEVNLYGKIYSDFAYRLGVIAKQYDSLQIEDEYKYESALYICILQNLLTQFNEVKKWATGRGRGTFEVEPIWDEELPFWGIDSSDIRVCNEGNLKIGCILDKIRDILSHPLPVKNGNEYISDSDLGKIVSYSFIGRNRQTGEIEFQVTLSSQKVKNLVANLSSYLSGNAKKITERIGVSE